ncbi:hypothetical protein [uncultured Varibaculum sp.]|uniref:hypothetical protein n=1 Tax=uncultured Varibaculum sp. TaxID=413896 RepID=UPI002596CEFC|nr:hypothetical protein [uncultured Varibaculum sp.]
MSQFNPNSNPNPNQSPYPYQQQPPYGQPFPQAPMQNYQNPGMSGVNPGDTGSFGWAVLGFFIPIAGLILWLVWKNTKPQTAIQCRNGFIAGVVVWLALNIIFTLIGASLFSVFSGGM